MRERERQREKETQRESDVVLFWPPYTAYPHHACMYVPVVCLVFQG